MKNLFDFRGAARDAGRLVVIPMDSPDAYPAILALSELTRVHPTRFNSARLGLECEGRAQGVILGFRDKTQFFLECDSPTIDRLMKDCGSLRDMAGDIVVSGRLYGMFRYSQNTAWAFSFFAPLRAPKVQPEAEEASDAVEEE